MRSQTNTRTDTIGYHINQPAGRRPRLTVKCML